jgi:chromosome segregation ATPase
MKSWLRVLVGVPTLCLASLPMLAQQQDASQQTTGDPVVDAARKSREDKKAAVKPKKVYTEDDISTKRPDSPDQSASSAPKDASANAPGGADNAAAGAPGDDKKDAKKDDEASWRKRFKELHAKIADAEKELDILQREGQKSQLQYYPDPQKALSQQYDRKDVNETYAKIAAKKQEVEQLKQSLSDMEEELRKSGGDPGWAN